MAQRREPDDVFFDDPQPSDIGSRALKGGLVTVSSQVFKFVLQMGSTMVLARLLAPSDFGLIAMVTVFVGFLSVFKDAGLSTATIQRGEITHRQVSALFWINVGLSFLLTAAAVVLAPLIAWFYDEPRLFGIAFGYAVVILVGGLGVQHQALLRRQMRFKTLAVVEILSMAIGVTVGIGMGFLGAAYWSIVGMHLSQAAINCILSWVLSGWRPGRPGRGSGVRPLIAFGLGLTGATFFNLIREQLPFLIIGKMLGSAPLAIFERAYKLLILPLNHMMPPLSAVALPALSRMSGEAERIRRTGRRLFVLISATTVPLSVIAVLTAPELIEIVLGDQWRRAAVIFALLSPLAATQAISSVAVWLLTACGRSRILFRFAVVNAVLAVASVWVGIHYSLEAAALAFSGTGLLLRTPLLYAVTVAYTPISWGDLLGKAGIFILTGLVVGAGGLLIRYGWFELTSPSYGWASFALVVVGLTWIPVAAAQGLPGMVKQWYGALRSPS